ncbi:MAG: hypothetical protein RL375_3597 [Pseudomonadota bacterium]
MSEYPGRVPDPVIGWDVGGAHLKAALLRDGELVDVAQWPCPLWLGQDRLSQAVAQARHRWPGVIEQARHGLTMTAEMVDLFPDRASGVAALAAQLAQELTGSATPPVDRLAWYAGPADVGGGEMAATATWLCSRDTAAQWRRLASANYLATASLAAAVLGDGVLVDIGSTTTDLIAFGGGSVLSLGQGDAGRLASGELVYQGVVRTPLIALAQRVPFGGQNVSVMNELFATSADVYRLTGELDDAHDQQPTADGAAKTPEATRQRLARLLGRDAADADPERWLDLARFWRERQLAELAQGLQRVAHASRLPGQAPLVAAGCGAFLVAELARDLGRPALSFGAEVLGLAPGHALTGWAQVCAPAVAVALLLET